MRITLIFFLFINAIHSQILNFKEIPILGLDLKVLNNAAMGGMDNPQIGEMDFDGDQVLDLLIFDRAGDVLLPYRYDTSTKQYLFSQIHKNIFPKVKDWVLLRDFNQDGLMDIFASSFNTAGIPGIELHIAKKGALGLEFSKFDMGKFFKVIYFSTGTGDTQIPTDFTDIPAIEDPDGDGDLDIILFEPGNNRATIFINVVKERAYSQDTLAFVLSDRCYGRFIESGFTSEITLSRSSDSCASFQNPILATRHAGSTLMSMDLNGDQLQDLLIGDLTNNGLIALYNGGTSKQAYFTSQLKNWPGGSDSVNLAIFICAFKADIDKDGLLDILVTPNQRSISDNSHNLWYYRNTGTKINPEFKLQTKSFLQNDMIDLGASSDPCFVDYNQDGKMDLLVGSEGYFIRGTNLRDARLMLFENVGQVNSPAYQLVDSNYLNFKEFALSADAHLSFSPTFGDLDSDGDLDMLVGENQGQFFYCENIAGKGKPFDFKKPVYPYMDLSVRTYSSPSIIDINKDGLMDIVSGSRLNTNDLNGMACGSFYYFQNLGTATNAFFDSDYYKSPNTNCLGRIIVNAISSKSYTCPEFYTDENGATKMLSGNIYGEAKLIGNISTDPNLPYVYINPHYGQLKEGERLTLSVADLDGDGILEMVTGNSRGGISFYETTLKIKTETGTKNLLSDFVRISPNPGNSYLDLSWEVEQVTDLQLLRMDGHIIFNITEFNGNHIQLDTEFMTNGHYIILVKQAGRIDVVKWIKI
ncbi:MAG: T9SS type A sorting domain-containing protein [Saprospiraceae bacterium]|nr:T9SS type A sorting domain-containing protein [Saprospiraceae bacterium]